MPAERLFYYGVVKYPNGKLYVLNRRGDRAAADKWADREVARRGGTRLVTVQAASKAEAWAAARRADAVSGD